MTRDAEAPDTSTDAAPDAIEAKPLRGAEHLRKYQITSETASERGKAGAAKKAARRAESKLSASDRARREFEADQDAIFANMRRIASGRDEYAKASEQIAAARWLAERAYGRPDIMRETEAEQKSEAGSMTEEQLREYVLGYGLDLG